MRKINPINISIFLVIISIIIILIFFFSILKFYGFADKNIDLEITNGIGTFIGGVIGAIFSLIGSLLIYETIRINKIDKTYDLNLNLFLRNIEKIDKEINEIKHNKKNGVDLINELSSKVVFIDIDDPKELEEKILYFIEIREKLENFSYIIKNSSKLLNKIINHYKKDVEKTSFLKTILYSTFDGIFLLFMKNFIQLYNDFEFCFNRDRVDKNIDFYKLTLIKSDFEDIINYIESK